MITLQSDTKRGKSMKDYRKIILNWTHNKRRLVGKEELLITLFEKGFANTSIPSKVYFGSCERSISFIMGGIYLIGYIYSGSEKGIWMLQDRRHKGIKEGIIQTETKSAKNFEKKIYWLHAENIEDLNYINQDKNIWESYYNASYLISYTKHGRFNRYDFIKDKQILTEFWEYAEECVAPKSILDTEIQRGLTVSKSLSLMERKKRFKKAPIFPQKVTIKAQAYLRNPDVIIEVLERANGKCELCKNEAPFIRESDGTPYLEVHHKIPLSENGEDTIDNAIALCPNCHRKQHFGKRDIGTIHPS